jgi:hypothetical protein
LETGIGQASDAFRNYIAALATLRKRTAHATTRARFQNEDDVSCDGANVRRFATANGGSTVVVANPRARRTTARITLESIPAAPHETVLYHLDGSVSRASAGRGDVLDLEVELPSRGVAVWETIPRGKETT